MILVSLVRGFMHFLPLDFVYNNVLVPKFSALCSLQNEGYQVRIIAVAGISPKEPYKIIPSFYKSLKRRLITSR